MLFELSDDQAMISEMVDRVAAEQHDFGARRAAIVSTEGWLPGFWGQLTDLGILGATLPADIGGLEGGPVAMMLIQQAFGRRLVLSPFASTMVAADILLRAGEGERLATLLRGIVSGERRIALALSERNAVSLDHLAAVAAEEGSDGYRIAGHKPLVVGASWCTDILVAALLDGEMAAFLVPVDLIGDAARPFQTLDGGRAADIRLDLIVPRAARVGAGVALAAILDRACDEMAVALCADACGSAAALVEATVDYAKTRRQFGQPIGRFQVLQHRMVDMMMERDQAMAITHRAALSLDLDQVERHRAVSAAKAHVGRMGRKLAQSAVQIHGGIGITDELDVTHHFRRIEMLDLQYGAAEAHVRRYANLLDEAPSRLLA